MLAVIAQCGRHYGVIDSNDNVVEWVYDSDLYEYVESGTLINGVDVSAKSVTVNPLFYVNFRSIKYASDTNIFEASEKVSKGYYNKAEMLSGGVLYKVRALKAVDTGSKVKLFSNEFIADESGMLIKLSNGICTIIPFDLFDKLFDGIIDTSDIS